MYFQVRVRVDITRMAEFGTRLGEGSLDRSAIRGETYCLADDPAVGFSVWEARDRAELEAIFAGWKRYYTETEVRPLITPAEAMMQLAR
jgi:hypothetical protein